MVNALLREGHLPARVSAEDGRHHAAVEEVIAGRQRAQQVAQLSQRDRAAGWVSYGQKWKTEYLRTI